jgi:hypothetical protein
MSSRVPIALAIACSSAAATSPPLSTLLDTAGFFFSRSFRI